MGELTSTLGLSAVPRLFTPEIASFYEGYYEAKGIKVFRGRLAAAIVQHDGQPEKVRNNVVSFFTNVSLLAHYLLACALFQSPTELRVLAFATCCYL